MRIYSVNILSVGQFTKGINVKKYKNVNLLSAIKDTSDQYRSGHVRIVLLILKFA